MEEYVVFTNNYMEETANEMENDTIARICIDGFPEGELAEGAVIATVAITKHEDIVVDWHLNSYRMNNQVLDLIDESKSMLMAYVAGK